VKVKRSGLHLLRVSLHTKTAPHPISSITGRMLFSDLKLDESIPHTVGTLALVSTISMVNQLIQRTVYDAPCSDGQKMYADSRPRIGSSRVASFVAMNMTSIPFIVMSMVFQ
jgi:hypothetical protein